MRIVLIISLTSLLGCATNKLHDDVELGNESNNMMQCKILCDGTDKPYAFTENSLVCQCQRPVEASKSEGNATPIVIEAKDYTARGVMGQLLNGRLILSTVKGD